MPPDLYYCPPATTVTVFLPSLERGCSRNQEHTAGTPATTAAP
ncbi:hypothetical protein Hsw_2969 [Hymenobacter swuensis DY53]|uniref:Uncharacterized protein n=1 Tax=Hymenobacter swuensis DY53 TaxID=1227739 RepID=W8EZN5_9BACT|nr:hypothetical protein Hsw_2969 [Hymenobacter swuensis DY53]